MPELQFNCPQCSLLIACDEQWAGQQTQCPGCQAAIIVPEKQPAAPVNPLVPQVPTGAEPRLSIGQARHQAATRAPQASAPTPGSTFRGSRPEAPKKKNKALEALKIVAVIAVLGVAGFFGFKYVKQWQDKRNADSAREARNRDGGQVGHIANLYEVLDATEPGHGLGASSLRDDDLRAGREKNKPPVAPVWTLDLAAAKIPDSPVNGTISGATNFVAEETRLDVSNGSLVLRFVQGTLLAPERELLIYLRLKAGEKLAGHTWSITADTKPALQVTKRWKPAPGLAPKLQSYSTGYAMKLELGSVSQGEIPGKIFIALPDTEHSVVAGIFTADTSLPDSPVVAGAGATNAAPAAAPMRPAVTAPSPMPSAGQNMKGRPR